MKTRSLLAACAVGLLSSVTHAQELPVVAEYSGTFRLTTPLLLPSGVQTNVEGTLELNEHKPAKRCRLRGTIWSQPARMERYEDMPHVVVVVPESLRVLCPGEPARAILGSFSRLPFNQGWQPPQTWTCVKRSPRKFLECHHAGIKVEAGTAVDWITWYVSPLTPR